MNNKKFQTALPILFSLAVVLGMFVGYKLHGNMPTSKNLFNATGINKMEEVLSLVKQRYVETVNIDSISEMAIEEMLTGLDPHSVYIPSSSLSDVNEDLEGRFEGIGVEFNMFNDTVHILSVLPNGPADKAKLMVGDRILKVDDSLAVGDIETARFKKWVKGPAGTEVKLMLERDKKILYKTVVRGSIPIVSIDAAYMINDKKGYIRLNRFSGTSYEEFMKSLETLKAKGLQSLVLDLRDNGGGIMDEAVDIADEFIGGNNMLVYTEGKNSPKKEYICKRPGLFEEGELVVLMNEGSASASEVLAGALQDLDRATIIGRRSFGKGLVQEQYTLSDGSALRLTVAKYYTPLGRSIQRSYKNGNEAYQNEVIKRYHNQQEQKSDTNLTKNTKKYKTASGKLLYSGGGITPDVFVALDTTYFDAGINKFYVNNTIGNFSYNYFIENKNAFKKYKSAADFVANFNLPENILDRLEQFAMRDSIKASPTNANAKQYLKTRIKALIARILWDENGYYQVINGDDETFRRAAVGS